MSECIRRNILYIVVPCYNEEEVLETTTICLLDKLAELESNGEISPKSCILYVNDGSTDCTWSMIEKFSEQTDKVCGINFAGNRGHQNAIMAGMMVARKFADFVITIDADLQQDVNAISEFIQAYQNGNDVVYGVRNDRKTDGIFKRFTAVTYYRLMRSMGCDILLNSADYRLLSKKALDALAEYKEVNLFLRGLIPTMGFKSDIVYFEVKERMGGTSKYTLKKMLSLALNGVISLSLKPIRIITGIGVLILLIGFGFDVTAIIMAIQKDAIPLAIQIISIVWPVSGSILIGLGIIGEYIGKICSEVRGRPRYIIKNVTKGLNDMDFI